MYSAATDTDKLLGEVVLFIFIKRGALRIVLKWDFLEFYDQFVIFFQKCLKIIEILKVYSWEIRLL